MNLSEKAKSVCRQHYVSFKTPGCSKCPIQSECHGKESQSFNDKTSDGLIAWIKSINQAAERVG